MKSLTKRIRWQVAVYGVGRHYVISCWCFFSAFFIAVSRVRSAKRYLFTEVYHKGKFWFRVFRVNNPVSGKSKIHISKSVKRAFDAP